MNLGELVRSCGAEWVPEKPTRISEDRYVGCRSVYELELSSDLLRDVKEHFDALQKGVRPVTAWDRVLWDDPLERPSKNVTCVQPLFVHVFHGIDDLNAKREKRRWLYPVGSAIHDFVAHRVVPEDATGMINAWGPFARDAIASGMAVRRDQDTAAYLMEVERVENAAANLKTSWYDFLDATVGIAARGFKLATPPVFVILFLNMHLPPNGIENVISTFRTMGHPRLLCLLGKGAIAHVR